jgi:glycosyltransferase involved in cell wall biosynthesis
MIKRIWIVSELFYPEESATGYYLTKIAEGLSQFYSVNVLCGQPKYGQRTAYAPKYEDYRGITIKRCWSTRLKKDIILHRLINIVTISFSIFWKALRAISAGDYILVVTNPPSLPYFVSLACRLKGAKCVLLVHDVYPEVLTAAGILKEKSFPTRFLQSLSKWLYLNVYHIVVLGRDMKELVSRKCKQHDSKLSIITNWADIEQIKPFPRETNRLLQELKLNNKFIVQYSGNMGRTHGIELLFEIALRMFNRELVHFLFIGSGAKKEWLESAVRKAKIKNVTILPPRDRTELCDSLNACDMAIISFVPQMVGVSVPSRMYNILAAGKPIIAIAERNSELAMVINEWHLGWVISINEQEKIIDAIESALVSPQLLREIGIRARLLVEKDYSFKRVSWDYHELFEKLENHQP